jgi:5-methyltetrahydrofolate--homocysteine methyltransferase
MTVPVMNPRGTDKRQGGNLPHWSAEGSTYAVTFRLADSLPQSALRDYLKCKTEILDLIKTAEQSGDKSIKERAEQNLFEAYSEILENALEAEHGECLLRDGALAKLVEGALQHFDKDRYELLHWAVMPNHVHAILKPLGSNSISDILHSWKSFTAHEVNKHLGREGSVWQKESYDHLIRGPKDYANQAAYIERHLTEFKSQQGPEAGTEPTDHDRDGHATEKNPDYIGGFVVGIHGAHEWSEEVEKAENDPYKGIMIKAIADRLAEAFAELLHHRARVEWGYERPNEFNHNELIKEIYQGIRPAPGYPSQPDHTEKPALFDLLNAAEQTGVTLTESCAMHPGAAVSGLLFSHPESHYFAISELQKDQVEDYARRKNWTIEDAEKWLGPWLGYTN